MKRELVEASRRGDLEAFDALVRQEVRGVYRTALAILGRETDAEEATQDAFISVWRNFPRLRETDRFDAWLGRIVVNACRMTLRRRRSVREISLEALDPPAPAAGAPSVDPDTIAAEADAFDRAFERLSIDDRALLVLHYRDELGLREIADRLRCPTGRSSRGSGERVGRSRRISPTRRARERAG